jgi:aspartyl-tRNA(Asn)/glutamyl-tRNA(Gln) amidotransferase subunit C
MTAVASGQRVLPNGSGRVDSMDIEKVKRVAKVARLVLTDEELKKFAQDLEDILNNFSVLDEAPGLTEYDFNPVPVNDVLREDQVGQEFDPAELRAMMDTYEDYVRGPKLS